MAGISIYLVAFDLPTPTRVTAVARAISGDLAASSQRSLQ